jgi:hypothetical protein
MITIDGSGFGTAAIQSISVAPETQTFRIKKNFLFDNVHPVRVFHCRNVLRLRFLLSLTFVLKNVPSCFVGTSITRFEIRTSAWRTRDGHAG